MLYFGSIFMLYLSVLSITPMPYKSIDQTAFQTDSINKNQKTITKAFVLGQFNYRTDSAFVMVDTQFSTKTLYLQNQVYTAFLKMHDAAILDGVNLKIVSGTRNFNEQKAIWERKWNKDASLSPIKRSEKILLYSSMPGTSRHHWGTDMDLNHLTNTYFESGNGLKTYNWLVTNANSFGFYQVYTSKENGRTGYNEEKWHWSYIPLACEYLEYYNTYISETDISSFKGSELATELHMIPDFVNGISNKAKLE